LRSSLFLIALCAGAREYTGSGSCAPCHKALYDTYARSGMARTSGFVSGVPAGEVRQRSSGATFQITPGGLLRFRGGERQMSLSIGSGAVGRSFAFQDDGFLFQAPVSYYSRAGKWDVSPGFQDRTRVDIARPIESPCLRCHATRPRLIQGTANRYEAQPFLEPGVGCEMCHGPGSDHVLGPSVTTVVNPARLTGEHRANICEQCHLTGAAKVDHRPYEYQPGGLLRDFVAVFVGGSNRERAASDHAEQLALSGCSKDPKFWCGTCHSVHGERKANVCADCHPVAHTRENCVGCHMPKRQSREGEHVAFTDHTISPKAKPGPFRPYWPGSGSERDLAIATRNRRLLEKYSDIESLVQLAQLVEPGRARAIYERIYTMDPQHPAAANLGVLRAMAGEDPVPLWKDVFARHPYLLSVGKNLAAAAPSEKARVLRFHPDAFSAGR